MSAMHLFKTGIVFRGGAVPRLTLKSPAKHTPPTAKERSA